MGSVLFRLVSVWFAVSSAACNISGVAGDSMPVVTLAFVTVLVSVFCHAWVTAPLPIACDHASAGVFPCAIASA